MSRKSNLHMKKDILKQKNKLNQGDLFISSKT